MNMCGPPPRAGATIPKMAGYLLHLTGQLRGMAVFLMTSRAPFGFGSRVQADFVRLPAWALFDAARTMLRYQRVRSAPSKSGSRHEAAWRT